MCTKNTILLIQKLSKTAVNKITDKKFKAKITIKLHQIEK